MSFRTRALLFWQGYALIGTLVFQPTAWAEPVGGIATDGTMGAAQVLGGVNVTVPQALGTTVGNNLFHSFSEFNIAPGQTVDFTGSNALQNVISRVTGSNPSDIDGTLKSSIANAAFYFINPNGITFGANAQIDVPGAFHVSTADKIDFPNSAVFYAGTQPASTLSSEAPAAFGFLDTSSVNNGLIAVDGAQLAVNAGKTLDMVAGGIDIKNYANVNASAGEIRLAALQGSGVAGLQQSLDGVLPLPAAQPSAGNAGQIAVNSSSVGASGDGGGRISLWGGNISLVNNAAIYVDNEGDADATPVKGIDIRSHTLSVDKSLVAFDAYWGAGKAGSVSVASQNIDIFNGGSISSNSFSGGDAGKVQIAADTLRIDRQGGSSQTGIASDAIEGSSGNAGNVAVSVKNLEVLNGGTISSDTLSSGNAGTVEVVADTLRIDGQGGSKQTGIASDAVRGSTGNAGAVSVSAKNLDILSIGSISSNTWSTGDAGIVEVIADKLQIDGQGNTEAATGIFTGVYSDEQQSGNAGDLSVKAGTLDILKGGLISSSTFSQGNAGRVVVTADILNIDSQGFSPWATGIVSKAEAGSRGNAGDLNIQAGAVNIVNSGTISSNTLSSGNAGTVQVVADTLLIDGQGGKDESGISSDAKAGSIGNAGVVSVYAQNLDIFKGGLISSSTFAKGNAGSVIVKADSLKIDSQGFSPWATGILSQAERGSSGQAGNVAIQAGTLNIMNGGDIASSTFAEGDAGNVIVTADSLTIDSQGFLPWATGILSQAESGSNGQAGNVIIQAGALDIMNSGSIASSTFSKGDAGGVILSAKNLGIANGGAILSNTWSSGDAGAIVVDADTLRIDGQGGSGQTGIASDAKEGSSGNAGGVIINAQNLDIVNSGTISSNTWSSGDAGAVVVDADTLRIDGQGGSVQTGIASDAKEGSSGNAGGVIVSAKSLEILSIGSISSDTWSTGDAGIVKVVADKLRIDGQGNTQAATGIFTGVYSAEPHSGDAGDLSVQAGDLDIVNGGIISSSTFSSGHAGTVQVVADTLRIDGQGESKQITGIGSDAVKGSSGNAGAVVIKARNLDIVNGGTISSDTSATGDAGAISIEADTFRIDGQGGNIQTGVVSDAEQGSSGNAGGVVVSAKSLDILNIGSISSNTRSVGDAGIVKVVADKLRIDGQDNTQFQTGIFTAVYSTELHSGNGGDLTVRAGTLDILKGGAISSSTSSEGRAGQVFVEAATLNIDSQGFSSWATGISAEAADTSGGQTGNVLVNASSIVRLLDGAKISIENAASPDNSAAIIPGSITITAPDIVMKNSDISSTSTGNVAAGNIVLNFSHWLTMDPSFISTMANTGNGGAITINGGEAIYLENSGFSTTVSGADSNGGDISTKADILAMNNGVIQANAVGGSGGNINLNLKSLIPSGNTLIKGGPAVDWQPFEAGLNVIQAASQAGVNGEVNVTAPQLNLSGIIANLGGPQFETNIIAQDYCGVGTGSSLTRKGAGGVKPKSGDQVPF